MKTQKPIMLQIGGTGETKECTRIPPTKYILSGDHKLKVFDSKEVIPFDFNSLVNVTTVPHAPSPVNELGRQLLKASVDGDVNEVKNLLSMGVPFTADWLGTSPLHMAAQKNHLEICKLLLKAGISKDARTKVDRTPMHIAAYEGHLDIIVALAEVGADLDSKDLLGMTPLHWAVQNGHYPVVEYLAENGAFINQSNKFELTPIDIATQINRDDIVKFLNCYAMDASLAAELGGNSNNDNEGSNLDNNEVEQMVLPVDPIISSDDNEDLGRGPDIEEIEVDDDEGTCSNTNEEIVQSLIETDPNLSAIKLLHDHGITMLPNDNDDGNIFNSVMESGHSVVLTDVGKEVLNTFKQSEEPQPQIEKRKIITISPEEFLAMTNNYNANNGVSNKLNKLKVVPVKQGVKRVVMKKNRIVPITNSSAIQTKDGILSTDMEVVMKQLIEARKTIEEYKIKLQKKEQEAERYKLQLKLLMNSQPF